MNKTQIKQQINSRFYQYVTENFPQYELEFGQGHGRVYLIHSSGTRSFLSNESIEYEMSYHDLVCFNHSSKETKDDVATMQNYINSNIIPFVNTNSEL